MVTLEDIKHDEEVRCLIVSANDHLGAIGFTEHSFRHIQLVSNRAKDILLSLNYPERTAELAAISGFLHDIGNVITREDHARLGALLAKDILKRFKMPMHEIATILGAIGNHDEHQGVIVNDVTAALVLADKSDAHRSRVRNKDFATFDIHDRVNYAVTQADLEIDKKNRIVTLKLEIDQEICPVLEYFEIFMVRMLMCRRAADFLNSTFAIVINGHQML